jgi:molybdopterin synthase catalytic subunit
MNHVLLTHEPLDAQAALRAVTRPDLGGVALFAGVTRDNFGGRSVLRLEYEAFEPLALRQMEEICERARAAGAAETLLWHRLGVVPAGEASVIVAAAAPHRGPALAAVPRMLDELKESVAIWKKEIYEDGSAWKANPEALARRVP